MSDVSFKAWKMNLWAIADLGKVVDRRKRNHNRNNRSKIDSKSFNLKIVFCFCFSKKKINWIWLNWKQFISSFFVVASQGSIVGRALKNIRSNPVSIFLWKKDDAALF